MRKCEDDECRFYAKNWRMFVDFNNDGKVSYGEFQGFFFFLWGMKCHMCSKEFLEGGPKFLAWRVFAWADVNKDGVLDKKEIIRFCKSAPDGKFDDCLKMAPMLDVNKDGKIMMGDLEKAFRWAFA